MRDGRAEEQLLAGHRADGLQQIGLRAIFEQISLGAGRQGADQEGLIAVHAQHNDADVGIALDDLGGGIDAVQLRHGNIHDDDVGRELLGEANGFAAVASFADHFDGRVGLEQELKALADHAVIVGDEYFGGG